MTIRERLRGMKQREAAELIGKSRSFVAQLISRNRQPSMETLARIAARLGLDDAEIGASVREMYPDEFAPEFAPEASTDTAA